MGPAPDQPHFLAVVRQARAHHPALAGVLADAGYDGERYQKYLYERLGVLGVVMPKTGLPPPPTTKTTRRRRAGPEPKARSTGGSSTGTGRGTSTPGGRRPRRV